MNCRPPTRHSICPFFSSYHYSQRQLAVHYISVTIFFRNIEYQVPIAGKLPELRAHLFIISNFHCVLSGQHQMEKLVNETNHSTGTHYDGNRSNNNSLSAKAEMGSVVRLYKVPLRPAVVVFIIKIKIFKMTEVRTEPPEYGKYARAQCVCVCVWIQHSLNIIVMDLFASPLYARGRAEIGEKSLAHQIILSTLASVEGFTFLLFPNGY